MGNVYLKQKKFPEAAEAFQYALAVNPRDTRAAEGLKQAQQQKVAAGTADGKSP
ncbi:MAG: tetratricopeptide repeat protein [Abditibacteriales bacterium]|nr:tetratricopeptide repeat protein [Abditibacteriales bacterium]